MKKVGTISVIFLVFFAFTGIAFAQVVINEVQIAPTAQRFIELRNTGSSDIDLTGWYIQRKTATGSNFGSSVTSPKFKNKLIKSGGYFLISRSPLTGTDIVADNLTLTKSNTLRLRNSKGKDVDQIEWGNLNKGESYQRVASGWATSTPTPGSSNGPPSSQSSPETTQSESSATSGDAQEQTQAPQQSATQQASAPSSSWPVEPQIFTRIKDATKIAVVGAGVLFKGEALGFEKRTLTGARYLWTFGDGGTKEGKNVLYDYSYPGKYVVVLNTSSGKYTASDRVTIEVIPANISISSVGTDKDSFVEIQNDTQYELNLSWWRLRLSARSAQTGAGKQLFIIPKDTIILANSKIIFSPQNTKFKILKGEKIDLLYPNGAPADTFSYTATPTSTPTALMEVGLPSSQLSPPQSSSAKHSAPASKPKRYKPQKPQKTAITITATTTTTTAIKNETKPNPTAKEVAGKNQSANIFTSSIPDKSNIYKWLLAVAALVIVSILGVLFTEKEAVATGDINEEANLSRHSTAEADMYEIIEDKN